MPSRPPYLPLLVGIWLVPLIITFVVAPLPTGLFSIVAPRLADAATLADARILDTFPSCYMPGRPAWQRIAADPEAKDWFTFIVRAASTSSGRYYGLVGLYHIDPTLARQALSIAPATTLDTLVFIPHALDHSREEFFSSVPIAILLELDSLAAFAHTLARPNLDLGCE